jgi:hypothetical protein
MHTPHHKHSALLLLRGIILVLCPGSAFAQATFKIKTLTTNNVSAIRSPDVSTHLRPGRMGGVNIRWNAA